ncbi:MAG TPA: lytic transglycosylase domain-containing protein [Thermoanaerobaculia bacterium]|nr:lytic transglycosylase domain-containing protein [Thermoanaerobaculia bacterium]
MKIQAVVCLAALLGPLAAITAAPAAAEVRVGVNADGRRVIFNENAVQHARRYSDTLVAVPDPRLEPLIVRHADNQQLDPKLVRAVIQVESGYNARALSRAGAMGLMQLMPDTAAELAVANPYDPEQNLRGGTTYLRRMIDRFAGRLEFAVAAYNAGPEAVVRHGGVPPYPDTRDYVRRVLGLYHGERGGPVVLSLSRTAAPAADCPLRHPHVERNGVRLLLTTAIGGLR